MSQIRTLPDIIKPCPFCGRDVEVKSEMPRKYYIECRHKKCTMLAVMTNQYINKESAIEAWNKREK